MRTILATLLLLLALPVFSQSTRLSSHSSANFPPPAARDLCPVCGMVVSKYPAWIASVVYKDAHAHHFDGAKDMFKYLFDLKRYAPGHRPEDIVQIGVTEYYEVKRIDARQAWFVIGSDVLGPMGRELIPFANRADAEEFRSDHKGKQILHFNEVTRAVIGRLD